MKKLLLFVSFFTLIEASELDLGFGAGAMFYPDYLGSENNNVLLIPYPYINYTSENLSIDKDGLEKKLFEISDFSLELSASGSLPVKSSGARAGMSDLDPALELGTALIYNAYQSKNLSLKLDAPLRAVLSTDWNSVNYRGYIYELRAELEYNYQNYLFQLHTGGVWGDKKYHNYLYGVGTNDVTATRSFYQGKAGYSGYKTSMGVSKKFQNIWAGTFVRHYNLNNSSYQDSPLKTKNSALYAGVFMAYLFNDSVTKGIKNWIE